ncbi:hypothetical protein [Mucilaginibacter ginsenosidivorans]|uniref:Uncharacterized protein n=1 Tax=Mucilaginibacter ginsenosidivorans TaxID=398053 RepID=A0A5B8V2I4_9SPHI|nr:hypothetical protein [Mucilaginibacter ginsenosidivorans]QEC65285.1 hypothetical protein FRZ54_22835 [Mucilaginibacter ginsenosidivorans]
MKNLAYIFIAILICSCRHGNKNNFTDVVGADNKKIPKAEIDNLVKKYQTEDFSAFKNVVITIGLSDSFKTTYTLNRFNKNSAVYFVTVNESKNKITGITNPELQQQKGKDYFTASQIDVLINKFRKLDFKFLSVDDDSDVFINPFYAGHPPCLIRLAKKSNLNSLKITSDFKHYKDDWYIDKSLIDPH